MVKMLNIIRMSKNDIKKLKLVKNGNCGTTSKVYKLNDKECIKVFNNSMDEFDLYRMNRFTKMSFEGANLPKVLVLINNKSSSYVCLVYTYIYVSHFTVEQKLV